MDIPGRSKFYNVCDFGAIGDGATLNTQAIQHAITTCADNGGGTVYVPAVTYLTGAIHLRSHITLFVEAGATLLFSQNFQDYPFVPTRWEGVECYGFSPLIYGKDLEQVSLIGRGTLDGQGEVWWKALRARRQQGPMRPETDLEKQLSQLNPRYATDGSGGGGREIQFLRPPLVQFYNCRNLHLEGLTHQNSPFWNTHLVYCDNVCVNKVTFKNPSDAPNTDGMNLDSCQNVRVSNCYFDVGDDCLCLKSGIDKDGRRVGKPTENVTITNCTMLRGHGGVVIGSEMAGCVRNVTISNCIFLGTDRGIRMKSRRGRGGIVEDICVDNILMKDVLCPFTMNLFYRCGAKPEDAAFLPEFQPVTEETPIFRNISLSNIQAKDVRAAAGFLYGLPEMPVQDIRLSNVSIEMVRSPEEQGGEADMVFGLENMAGRGIWGKHVRRLQLQHVTITPRQGEGILLEQSADIDIHGFNVNNLPQDTPGIVLHHVERAYIQGCRENAYRTNFIQQQASCDILCPDHALRS